MYGKGKVLRKQKCAIYGLVRILVRDSVGEEFEDYIFQERKLCFSSIYEVCV